MKVALLADIHGNARALDAVLHAAQARQADMLLIAGDFVGYYWDADRVLERLRSWTWHGVKGNHEAMLADWLGGRGREAIERRYGPGLGMAAERLDADQIALLANLPISRRLSLEGRDILLCHGTPDDCDRYVYPDADRTSRAVFLAAGADLVVYGHTHHPVVWRTGSQLVVNPGSVGQPRDRIPGACWALWDCDDHAVTLHREPYDIGGLVEECRRMAPAHPYLVSVLTRSGDAG